MNIVYKFLTYCYNGKEISKDPVICKYLKKLQRTTLYAGPIKYDCFTVWKAPGFRYYDSPSHSFAIVTFLDVLVACCMIGNRVYYWYIKKYENKFEYDNFMFHPRYPVLANMIYNLYYEANTDPFILPFICQPQPWRIFPTHLIFSPGYDLCHTKGYELKSGMNMQETTILTLEVCISVYGEYDEENLTNTELTGEDVTKPWEVITAQDYDVFKGISRYVRYQWKSIEDYLHLSSFDFITLEAKLCDIRTPYDDEAYKFIAIALDIDSTDLYKWVLTRYKVARKRVLNMVDFFPKNSVTLLIKSAGN